MNNAKHARLLILGSGPAGYSAAIYAARANLRPTLITGAVRGGQLMSAERVDYWPADHEGLQGAELMERFRKQAEQFGAEIVYDHINAVKLGVRPFRLAGVGAMYTCEALIIATGYQPEAKLFNGQMRMINGYVLTRGGSNGLATMTSVPGIFAAGDVQDHAYRQTLTSAAAGCMAAVDAQRYLETQNRKLINAPAPPATANNVVPSSFAAASLVPPSFVKMTHPIEKVDLSE